MSDPSKLIFVSMHLGDEIFEVGRLALLDRNIVFEYTSEFIQTGIELSPFKLPLRPGVFRCEDRLFEGLFGVFNDSLPDGWGRLLLDRQLMAQQQNPGALNPLDRLRHVGNDGMGALLYQPAHLHHETIKTRNLDHIAHNIMAFQTKNDEQHIDELLKLTGSSAGARPKILITHENAPWIVKFRSSIDPEDIGAIEYAYHLLAKAAGLELPEAQLMPSKNGPGYFAVKRFDRTKHGPLHMHTLSGLLHADHRIPSLDYETVLKATAWLTKSHEETLKQYRACVFNVVFHNRDDHAKNFSFLMSEKGEWHVSPAYDLTFSSGPNGEHSTTVSGEGRAPSLTHLMRLAESADIKKQTAYEIIESVQAASSSWSSISKAAGVSAASKQLIEKQFLIKTKL
jgi:serine/threonine-protein kinase HipA